MAGREETGRGWIRCRLPCEKHIQLVQQRITHEGRRGSEIRVEDRDDQRADQGAQNGRVHAERAEEVQQVLRTSAVSSTAIASPASASS